MSEHKATITWTRTSPDFLKGKFSREHTWTFDGTAPQTGVLMHFPT